MRFDEGLKLDFKDVLLRPKRSTLASRSMIDLNRRFTFCHTGQQWEGIPIIAANMDHTGTLDMAKTLGNQGLMTALSKFYNVDELKSFYHRSPQLTEQCFVSAGLVDEDFEALKTIMAELPFPFICLDVANGYTQKFVDYVRQVRNQFPDHIIMAGNVVTGEMTEELILSGADIVKVGIGPGSVCTTRNKTGIGYPQLSAVIECADAAHGLQGQICSDGGCRTPGDVVKAFAAGADFVMLGGMFSGHDECEGEIFDKEGRQVKRFYGMSSREAMERHKGKVANYRASEGKSVEVPYKGPVENTLQDILGGLRSACTYVGSPRLKTLPKCATFLRVTTETPEQYG